MAKNPEVTQLLIAYSEGKEGVLNELMPAVYNEMRQMAKQHLRYERADHTLNTTALVHEAFLKLVDQNRVQWQNRNHFFAIAAKSMRRILVNYARHRHRLKRGGKAPKVSIDDVQVAQNARPEEIIILDEALERLEKVNERRARVVECRYFGGYSIEETAEILEISSRTVKRDWTLARAWLFREISDSLEE